jgi:uncharacterized protein YqcC (DUF446 family)
MTPVTLVNDKVYEVIDELKRKGLWKYELPRWVSEYQEREVVNQQEFLEWLQFVYLPNILPQSGNCNILLARKYVAPQAIKFFGNDTEMAKIMMLLIELDSLG